MAELIDRQKAIDKIKKRLFETAFNNVGIKQNIDETLVDVAEDRLETWFDDVPSIQPDVIRCKDCVNYIDNRCTVADHHVAPFSCCQDVFNARRRG